MIWFADFSVNQIQFMHNQNKHYFKTMMCDKFNRIILWRRETRIHTASSHYEEREEYLDVLDGSIEVCGVLPKYVNWEIEAHVFPISIGPVSVLFRAWEKWEESMVKWVIKAIKNTCVLDVNRKKFKWQIVIIFCMKIMKAYHN